MSTIDIDVVGIGAWSAAHADWPSLRDALTHPGAAVDDDAPARAPRPSACALPAAERRRTPDGVAVAITAARQAVAAAGDVAGDVAGSTIDVTTLASVFASGHGDLAIVDYLCTTLATDPCALSPTRFHLSVHNAAAGYWSIAMHDQAPTNATAAGDDSFALGLLEAATLAAAEDRAVLLVAFDTPATGLLAASAGNCTLSAFAMIVRPARSDAPSSAACRLSLSIVARTSSMPMPSHPRLRAFAHTSPAARALALAEAIARGTDATVAYPVGSKTTLDVRVHRPSCA